MTLKNQTHRAKECSPDNTKDTDTMDRIKTFINSSLLMVAFILGTGAAQTALAEDGNVEKRDHVCMMQDTILAVPGIPIEHEGRTYYGCCPMCNQNIKGDPDRYTKAQDPVTKATVDKASALLYSFKGRVYYFDTESSRSEFAKQPLAYLSGSSEGITPPVPTP